MNSILAIILFTTSTATFAKTEVSADHIVVTKARQLLSQTGISFADIQNTKWLRSECVGVYLAGTGIESDSTSTKITGKIDWKSFADYSGFEVAPFLDGYYRYVDGPALPYDGGTSTELFKHSSSMLTAAYNSHFHLNIKAIDALTIVIEATMDTKAPFGKQLSAVSGLSYTDPQNQVPYAYFICKNEGKKE
jgi:hypothetical protein